VGGFFECCWDAAVLMDARQQRKAGEWGRGGKGGGGDGVTDTRGWAMDKGSCAWTCGREQ
jgi:hypothetical protein